MRAPSSFHSSAAGPILSSAAARSGAVAASIGCTGRPTCSRTRRSPSTPSPSAIRASSPGSPSSISARRTSACGSPPARATASVTIDCSAPWRRSPSISRRRNSCSGAVAAVNSSASASRRSACEPEPAVPASRSKAASTAATDQRRLGGGRRQLAQRCPANPQPALARFAGQEAGAGRRLRRRHAGDAGGQRLDLGAAGSGGRHRLGRLHDLPPAACGNARRLSDVSSLDPKKFRLHLRLYNEEDRWV